MIALGVVADVEGNDSSSTSKIKRLFRVHREVRFGAAVGDRINELAVADADGPRSRGATTGAGDGCNRVVDVLKKVAVTGARNTPDGAIEVAGAVTGQWDGALNVSQNATGPPICIPHDAAAALGRTVATKAVTVATTTTAMETASRVFHDLSTFSARTF